MTEEILKDEILKSEILTEEQLDEVAGGKYEENLWDGALLKGLMNAKEPGSGDAVNLNDPESIQRAWAKIGVAAILYDDETTANEYYMDGKQISQAEAIDYVFKLIQKS